MPKKEVIRRLKIYIKGVHGSQANAAKYWGLTSSAVYLALSGKQEIPKYMLDEIGMEREKVVRYIYREKNRTILYCENCGKRMRHGYAARFCGKCYKIRSSTIGKAISKVNVARKNGTLPLLDGKIKCVDCGKPAKQYDHRDYSKPLDVDPVCRGCNVKRGEGKNTFGKVKQKKKKKKK